MRLFYFVVLALYVLVADVLGGCINVKKIDLCQSPQLTMPKTYGKCGSEIQSHWAHKQPTVHFHNARPVSLYFVIHRTSDKSVMYLQNK